VSKKSNHSYIKSLWKKGKIQRTSRITYDVVWNIILFFLVVGFIGIFFASGLGAGYFASLVKDEPIRTASSMEKDIYSYEETSKLYFANEIYLGDVRSDLHRNETSLDKISDLIIDAVIATEDESFNEHNGIVPKAIIRAILQEALNSDVKTGGSTLTQQLIKNQVLTNEVSFNRKAKEILLAMRLENFFEKDQILEAYLNIIPYGREASGRNIAGVQTAAQGIFGINADEVNLAQAAFLGGLPQSPSAYTPFKNTGGLKDVEGLQPGLHRMKTVLKRMYDAEYINKEQYEEALEYDIVSDFVEESESPTEKYPLLTFEIEKRAKDILMLKLAEDDGYTLEDINNDEDLKDQYLILADRNMRMNGYKIHSTINKEIYDAFKTVTDNYQHYGPDRTVVKKDEETGKMVESVNRVDTGSVLIENHTGRIISFSGGRGYSEDHQVNYAFNAYRSSGSTIKPLLDFAPAMEKGIVQPGTPILDYPRSFPNPGSAPYTVKNYGGGNYGLVSAREALFRSHNIPAVDTYMKMIHENPAQEYLGKMNFSKLAVDFSNPSLSIGGMTHGVSVEENTNAFATFGNDGKYVESYMIEKITTNDGEVIYEHEVTPVDIFTPQTNYLTVDMMRDVIRKGTATYLNSQIKHGGVDWAGKTGTSNNYEDAWFVGVNPNVTIGTWIGYDTPYDLMNSCSGCSLTYSQRVNKLWAELLNAATDIDPELMAPKERFQRPEGIVERSYCAISGMLPSDLCKKAGLVQTDLFNAKFVPTKVDDSLITGSYVTVDGKSVIAGPKTPKEFINGDGLTFNPEFLKRNGYDKLSDISGLYPRTNRALWEKISIPRGEIGSGLTDDGKAPTSPTSVKASGNQLTWTKSGSKDVVGYRIYSAANPDGNFKLIGSTTDTNLKITAKNAVFYVKAVDYFGLESAPSSESIVGNFDEPKVDDEEKNDEKEKNKEKEIDDKKDDKKDETEVAEVDEKEEEPKQEDENNE
jgi:penicillin-binding protein